MNQQINELAIQSGGTWRGGYAEQADGSSAYRELRHVDASELDLERFAKLVEAPLRSDIEELLQENKLLRARNDRLESTQFAATKTLEGLGYTYHGGELWKPSIGKQQSCYCLNCEELGKELAVLKAQPQQEPAKYEFQVPDGTWHPFLDKAHYENTVEDGRWPIRALYTSPPQRTWVGLTHEEHMELMTGTMSTSSRMAAVEAKLKEKNT